MLGEQLFAVRNLSASTESEYRRGLALAEAALPPVNRVSRQDVQVWVNSLAASGEFAAATLRKMLTGVRSSIRQAGFHSEPFSNISVSSPKTEIVRQPWTEEELELLLNTCDKDWLAAAILVATFTGPRAGALVDMSYDSASDVIRFPKQKLERSERVIPCPDGLRETVRFWVSSPRTKSSLSNEFTKLKRRSGFVGTSYDQVKVFHSLRHLALSKLIQLGVDSVAARIISGHRQPDEILQRYYTHHTAEDLRRSINLIRFPRLDRFLR
nr:tyrosine-type recombinase/integrase [Parvularcula mediterranea]